jgi:hypothetical protein
MELSHPELLLMNEVVFLTIKLTWLFRMSIWLPAKRPCQVVFIDLERDLDGLHCGPYVKVLVVPP